MAGRERGVAGSGRVSPGLGGGVIAFLGVGSFLVRYAIARGFDVVFSSPFSGILLSSSKIIHGGGSHRVMPVPKFPVPKLLVSNLEGEIAPFPVPVVGPAGSMIVAWVGNTIPLRGNLVSGGGTRFARAKKKAADINTLHHVVR